MPGEPDFRLLLSLVDPEWAGLGAEGNLIVGYDITTRADRADEVLCLIRAAEEKGSLLKFFAARPDEWGGSFSDERTQEYFNWRSDLMKRGHPIERPDD